MTAETATETKPVPTRAVGDPIEALAHFFILATTQDHSGARVAARLLLGLYNGYRFEFDLTDLRLLDASNLKRALALLELDARPRMEVHQWLDGMYGRHDFGMRFEHMAHRWGVKGKCKKADLEKVPAVRFQGFGLECDPCE
ncbi:DUF7673 family protein [Paracidovorax valerianellae]|uniref:DUF7673 family protein n=1 Tax=Paracidovorax valerianellae TaxID=187868 RepID=UPI00230321AE|nr:hypothetical protein [Paracidovorax valerianellae]MDA8444784.1 hypothetical protein [Paracidovorax valerianellae]